MWASPVAAACTVSQSLNTQDPILNDWFALHRLCRPRFNFAHRLPKDNLFLNSKLRNSIELSVAGPKSAQDFRCQASIRFFFSALCSVSITLEGVGPFAPAAATTIVFSSSSSSSPSSSYLSPSSHYHHHHHQHHHHHHLHYDHHHGRHRHHPHPHHHHHHHHHHHYHHHH